MFRRHDSAIFSPPVPEAAPGLESWTLEWRVEWSTSVLAPLTIEKRVNIRNYTLKP